ncbi:MAG: hypothetical protein LBI59_05040 [Candidatus Accumulibacter sp.]|jgi:hypothetical protein|nr:hypothetical protein [Accumulibacter sp.]
MKKIILALLALSFSTAASAAGCYQIFTSSNILVWQGTKPPVSLDRPEIDEEVKKMVPDGHLIIVDDQDAPCQTIDATRKTTKESRWSSGNPRFSTD